jgi:mannose-1-phosphate guanylyltransferase
MSNQTNKNNYAIIMAGGIGSRFWPWSKKQLPKQFLNILGTGQSLLQLTYQRFSKLVPKENILIVTNQIYTDLIKQQLPEIIESAIIQEPMARNTAPCIAYASFKILASNSHANFIVAPSDHLILNEDEFGKVVFKALDFIENNESLVTIGIKPDRPDTGYGYIQFVQNITKQGVFKVKTFTEKPNQEMAKTFLDSGDFLWNAGIFIWKGKDISASFETFQPDMAKLFKDGNKKYETALETEYVKEIYPLCKSISIDYAIMEKAENVCVIPGDFGWSDLGTWKSLFENRDKDKQQNLIQGDKIITFDVKNSLILNQTKDKLVAIKDLDGYIVVQTDDVLLICPIDKEQEVKEMVEEVKLTYKDKYV